MPPSFLNKVFGYKKHDDKEVPRTTRDPSESTLLDGKYETISPTLSPSALTFPDFLPTRDSDGTFSFFKAKPRTSQKPSQKSAEAIPHLTLHLPPPKEGTDSRELGIVFEADPDSILLDDAIIAAKRLTPLEALILIRLCAQAITERGLETLGVMHPHWFSASPDVQRKLISLFIRSLTPQDRPKTFPPTSTSPTAAFENELHYTRSPHDVAAVLRWGLRHLSLENGHFGKDGAEWAWYNTFFNAERNASYPPKSFSQLLLPQLSAPHTELLTLTLNVISTIGAHREKSGMSSSRLSKFLGLWLLVASRAEQSDDWRQFYARWERAGRVLEHIFLARLREESFAQRLPTRLQEIVEHYPYKGSSTEDGLLPRPRFSTRQYDALLVRVETVLTQSSRRPKKHPIQLLLEAFQLPIENPSGNEHIAFWNTIKATTVSEEAASSDSERLQFTRIFVDDTIQLLSLLSADNSIAPSPILLSTPMGTVRSRKRSPSPSKATTSNANNVSTPASPTSPAITDWTQFSLSGFGDTSSTQPLVALLDPHGDIEASQLSRKSSRQRDKSRSRRRSQDHGSPVTQAEVESIIETKLASVHVAQIDEAFIDFWSDAIVDPISSDWPTLVVCGLKQIPNVEQSIRWLVIEQVYSREQSQRDPSPDGRRGRSPRPSFKSDISGFRINSMFSSARKRFSVFSKSVTDLDPRKSGRKSPATGELGQILVEEESTSPPAVPAKADGNVAVGAIITSYAAVKIADQLEANEMSTAPITGVPPPDLAPVLKKESDPVKVATKAPSVEVTPQSGDMHNGSPVGTSEKAGVIEQELSCVFLGGVDPSANTSDPVGHTASADSTQGANGSAAPMSSPALATKDAAVGEMQTSVEQLLQGAVVTKVQPSPFVEQLTSGNDPLLADSAEESSNAPQVGSQLEDAKVVAMPSACEGTTVVVTPSPPAAVSAVDEAPEAIAEKPRVAEQPSWTTPTDSVAAFTVESVDHRETTDVPSLSAANDLGKIVSTAAASQPEPDSISYTTDTAEEAKEVTEIPTAPQVVAPVEGKPSLEISVGAYQHVGAVQVPAAELEALENVDPQLQASHDAASPLEVVDNTAAKCVAAELQVAVSAADTSTTHPIEGPSDEISLVTGTNTIILAVEAEHTADHVPTLATEEAHSPFQDTTIEVLEVPVNALSDPEAGADVTVRSKDVTPTEVQPRATPDTPALDACVVESQEDAGAPTPVPESAVLIHETPSPEITNESLESVGAASAAGLGLEVVKDEACEAAAIALPIPMVVDAQSPAEAEPPTQLSDTQQPAEVVSSNTVVAAEPTVEDEPAEPVAEGAQVHADVVRSASEPIDVPPTVIPEVSVVAQDTQANIQDEVPSHETASQSVNEAAKLPGDVVCVPEETSTATVETQLKFGTVHVDDPREGVEDAEPVPRGSQVHHTAEASAEAEDAIQGLLGASTADVDEMGGADGSQEAVVVPAGHPVATDVDVSANEPAGASEGSEPVEA